MRDLKTNGLLTIFVCLYITHFQKAIFKNVAVIIFSALWVIYFSAPAALAHLEK